MPDLQSYNKLSEGLSQRTAIAVPAFLDVGYSCLLRLSLFFTGENKNNDKNLLRLSNGVNFYISTSKYYLAFVTCNVTLLIVYL